MENTKVSAYGGLFTVTKRNYTIIQLVVFAILIGLLISSFIYDLDRFLFGNAKIAIVITAILEAIETVYIFRKFKKLPKDILESATRIDQ